MQGVSATSPATSIPRVAAREGRVRLAAGLLVVAGVLAYCNSLTTPFVFDDVPSIQENPAIRRLWPLGDVLWPRQPGGLTTSGRPLLSLSFALNHAVGGERVTGYHVVNLAIHVGAAWLLFGIVRRTLPRWRASPAGGRGRCGSDDDGESALRVAFAVALIWVVHPLTTAAVTYVVQRAESLAALFYLLTLYAFIRGIEGGPRWRTGSVIACLLGLATKETVATAPLLVLAYDRTFVAGSFAAALRQRRGYYLCLAATWILLASLLLANGTRGGTAGFGTTVSAWAYLCTQAAAIVKYLWLAVWPQSLVFDYGAHAAGGLGAVWPQAGVVAALLAASVRAWRSGRAAGFLGVAFFVVLAPSSSVVPVATQTIAEHRMYLPLAVVIALVVAAAFVRHGRGALIGCVVAAVALGGLTVARNRDYRSELALWRDSATKFPGNARAHNNLGQALFRAGQIDQAIRHYQRAIELRPSYPEPHYNLGVAFAQRGDLAQALAAYEGALRLEPDYPEAHNNIGNALLRAGRAGEGMRHYAEAIARRPGFAEAHNNLGHALLEGGRAGEALPHLERAARLQPGYAEAHYNLGNALAELGRMPEALERYRAAIAAKADYAEAHVNAGNALLALERPNEAAAHYEKALALDPRQADAHNNLGTVYLHTGRVAEAAAAFQRALALRPDFDAARQNLAEARARLR